MGSASRRFLIMDIEESLSCEYAVLKSSLLLRWGCAMSVRRSIFEECSNWSRQATGIGMTVRPKWGESANTAPSRILEFRITALMLLLKMLQMMDVAFVG
jgi:hypothetical protein